MRALRILAAAALLAGVVSASAEAADRRTVASNITRVDEVTSGNQVVQITGRVTSRSTRCIAGRELRAVVAGAGIFFGTGTTDSNGAFVINGSGARDVDYRITLKRSRQGAVLCGGDVHVEELG